MKRRQLFTVLSAVLLSAAPALATSQGEIGETSTGSSSLTLTIPKLIVIDNFSALTFGSYSGTGDLSQDSDLRVATNNDEADPTYEVKALGDGTSSAFTVARTAGNAYAIPYKVFFNDQTGTTGSTEITAPDDAGKLTGQTGIHADLGTSTDNANLQVVFEEAELQDAPPGDYEGELTLVVTPE